MRVLVTGGAGYLGSVLCQRLISSGHHVTVLDKGYWGYAHLRASCPTIDLREKDVRHLDAGDLVDVEAVVHLAGLSNDPTAEFREEANQIVNVEASQRLWACCQALGRPIRVLFASTASLYDGITETEASESTADDRLCHRYPYSESKYAAEQALVKATRGKSSQLRSTIMRMGTLWGVSPRMRTDLAVNAMVLSAMQTGRIVVQCDGMQWRPMCHVQDAADAYVRLLDDHSYLFADVVNVVSGNWLLVDLAHRISRALAALTCGEPAVVVTYGTERYRSYRVSGDRLRGLGWRPSCDLQAGVEQIVSAWESRGFPDRLRSRNIEWMEHLFELEPFFRANAHVL